MKSAVSRLIFGERAIEIDNGRSPPGSDQENSGCVVVVDEPAPGVTGFAVACAIDATAAARTAATTRRRTARMECASAGDRHGHVPRTSLVLLDGDRFGQVA